MTKIISAFSLPALLLSTACVAMPQYSAAAPEETPIVFEANNGETVDAFRGRFTVPENRANPDSRSIEIGYVRFPATGDAADQPPIIYLAGGPGGSGTGTARGRRFPLFMAMRAFGDVIAFDQRGTGLSDDTPECVSSVRIPEHEVTPRDQTLALLEQSVAECAAYWRAEGIDPSGYTTAESARDIDALRDHLGAEKVSLWGISYGTHLALAAVKEMEPRIDRMVMTGAEGLDQTVKLPARTDAYFERLQTAFNRDAAPGEELDIFGLMKGVHAKLDAAPVMLELATSDGETHPFLLTREGMQRIASAMIADPQNAAMLVQIYQAVAADIHAPVEQLLARFMTPGEPVSWRVMPLAMDLASGIDATRLAAVNEQAETSLLGDILNFPMPHLRGAMGLDLGADFRQAPSSGIPTLLLTGTLDGRTYPDGQAEAFSRFSNLTTITVKHAGHNLFMASPAVGEAIQSYMRGDLQADMTITLDPPALPER